MLMYKQSKGGFTIVELLIVIVVIAILAAITIVAYNGVTQRTKENTAKLAAAQVSHKVKAYSAVNSDDYPSQLEDVGIIDSATTTYLYTANNEVTPSIFCVSVTSGDQIFHMDQSSAGPQAGLCSVHSPITNLLIDPSLTLAANYTISGTGDPISIQQDGTSHTGLTYIRKAFTGTSAPQVRVIPDYPITAGQTYTFSCWTRNNTSNRTMTARITWYDASSSTISVQPGTAASGSVWARTWVDATAPANAVTARFTLTPSSAFGGGNTLDVDSCMLTTGSTLHTYADGDSPGWSWNGTPHASTSTGPAL